MQYIHEFGNLLIDELLGNDSKHIGQRQYIWISRTLNECTLDAFKVSAHLLSKKESFFFLLSFHKSLTKSAEGKPER